MCDRYTECVAIDWDYSDGKIHGGNGYAHFSSAAAIYAIKDWAIWRPGQHCRTNCYPKFTDSNVVEAQCFIKDIKYASFIIRA
eukprot:gene17620-5518_t